MIEIELQDYQYSKHYYIKGTHILHREDGPAVEDANGGKYWYQNGQYHREDGPAVVYNNGNKYWYLDNEKIDCNSQQEFENSVEFRKFKLRVFW